ncbi:MAG: hypothetical protein OEW31_01075 [Thermoleophilia bacterium]|nr:hypothetical protein [Thermoleophilia bacterium]MDH4344906.1 hypothetical protein [Thermoleophilia bacterium]MDH5332352.1 hypothetical protein [Thermoleophilia bacterium]
MIVHKFLRPGAVGHFSGFPWPVPQGDGPGVWVEAKVDPCRSGIHACVVADLPFWMLEELWVTELDGPVTELRSCVVAPRGRLVRRVEGWDGAACQDFCNDCLVVGRDAAASSSEAAAALPFLESAASRSAPAEAALVATHLFDHVGSARAERLRQARWLADRLGLDCAL